MKDKKQGRSAHWLRPLDGKWRGGQHLLLWPTEEPAGKRVRAKDLAGIVSIFRPDDTQTLTELVYHPDGGVDQMIAEAHPGRGTLTVWLPGGWDHLVLTGLADLMDQGVILWRYCSLESHRVLIRGQWRSQNIIITSLANWTGGTWDQWRSKTASRGMALFDESFSAIAVFCKHLGIGSIPPSASAAGLLWWRAYAGPRVDAMRESPGKVPGGPKGERETYVAPLPSRPERCRHAERHCAYGLVHRQMRSGFVDQKIFCVDLREAYLTGLMTMCVPLMYVKTLHRPSLEELAEALNGHTGCALVQVRSPETPYPARKNGRVHWATGEFWTWLAGTELACAVANQQILQTRTAYLWIAWRYRREVIESTLNLGASMVEHGQPLVAAAWRSLYSQMVGRFAAWRKRWVDAVAHHNFGRWSAWHGMDPVTGAPVSYRSVAGRVQRLSAREDAGDSVALLFACVTSQVRYMVSRLCDLAGRDNVLAIESDAVWLLAPGWQALQRRLSAEGVPPDYLQCKEVFDRAWMSGQAWAVVESEGKQFLRCPGVPADIAVGTTGDVRWPVGADWHTEGTPDAKRGVVRTERRFSVKEIVKAYQKPAVALPYSEELHDVALPESLLQPLGQPDRRIDDV